MSTSTSTSTSIDDLKLIGAQIFFRHGARTPLHLLHGLDEVIYGPEHFSVDPSSQWPTDLVTRLKNEVVPSDQVMSANDFFKDKKRLLKSSHGEEVSIGQLTSMGEKQLFQLGQSIQQQLFGNENEEKNLPMPKIYHPRRVFCRSTYMNRTIASGRAFLAGFFTFDGQIRADGPFRIEVQHFPNEDMFPNPGVHPILKDCPRAEQLYQIFDDQHQLKTFRRDFLRRLGLEQSPLGLIELSDDLVSRQAHGFPIPPHLHELMEQFDTRSAEEFVEMAHRIDLDSFLRCACGSLLTSIKNNFDSVYEHYLSGSEEKEENQRFFVYSGHDTTLIPLAMALEIFDMRWPKYGSHLLVQFFVSKSNENERYLLVDYANQPKKLFSSSSIFCPYSTFVNSLEHRFATSTPAD